MNNISPKLTQFLLEIGTEEIPAGYIPIALEHLNSALRKALKDSLLEHGPISTAGTPRRLTVHVDTLAAKQPDRERKVMGPPKNIAFDPDGNPTKAAEGFARRNDVSIEQIAIEATEKGEYLCIRKQELGRPAIEILGGLLPGILASIPFPKTMRWGQGTFRFARPVRWIAAIIGEKVIPFEVSGIFSDRITYGHRFMSQGQIRLDSASFDQYLDILQGAYCIADISSRRAMLLEAASDAAARQSGILLKDQDLEELNTFLTEYPSATCGNFDEKFLALPDPVLITCMKEHQKYFAVTDKSGALKANFVAINNTLSPKPDLVRKGHERVLTARLSDAEFFFHEDRKRKLDDFVQELEGIIFHKGLGTLMDKTNRVIRIATYLSSEISPSDMETVKRAAYLCKADLCTEMVGEFPSLQGIMGREYALLSGEPEAVATAIEEHYLPVRSGGRLPETMPGTILSIADKADTITGTFAIGLRPTGTQDPYALRRQALGIIHVLIARELHISLTALVTEAIESLDTILPETSPSLRDDVMNFIGKRLAHDLMNRGLDYDVVDASINAGVDSPSDCYQRAMAINAVRTQPEFEPISIAFKRVMNILKGFPGGEIKTELFQDKEERELYEIFLQVKQKIAPLVKLSSPGSCPDAGQYQKALLLLLSLKPFIDSFFDHVMVMVEDEELRRNRLALLWMIARLFLRIGDLSRIVTEG